MRWGSMRGATGLVDTATGQTRHPVADGGHVEGRTATSNDLVFTVDVDGTGNVTLDQLRAVVHPNRPIRMNRRPCRRPIW